LWEKKKKKKEEGEGRHLLDQLFSPSIISPKPFYHLPPSLASMSRSAKLNEEKREKKRGSYQKRGGGEGGASSRNFGLSLVLSSMSLNLAWNYRKEKKRERVLGGRKEGGGFFFAFNSTVVKLWPNEKEKWRRGWGGGGRGEKEERARLASYLALSFTFLIVLSSSRGRYREKKRGKGGKGKRRTMRLQGGGEKKMGGKRIPAATTIWVSDGSVPFLCRPSSAPSNWERERGEDPSNKEARNEATSTRPVSYFPFFALAMHEWRGKGKNDRGRKKRLAHGAQRLPHRVMPSFWSSIRASPRERDKKGGKKGGKTRKGGEGGGRKEK